MAIRFFLPTLLSIALLPACETGTQKIASRQQEGDPRNLTYAEWKRETEAGRGDSLARSLTPDEIEAISAGILSHKGDSAAVAVLTMHELIDLGKSAKKGTPSSGRTQ